MAKNGFLISPSLHQDIKRTIARVNGIPFGGEVTRIPTDLSDIPSAPGSSVKFASFGGTTAWIVGQPRTVTFLTTSSDTASNPAGVIPTASASTAVAYSCLFSIPGNTSTASISTSLVAITKINGNWQVIAAVAN